LLHLSVNNPRGKWLINGVMLDEIIFTCVVRADYTGASTGNLSLAWMKSNIISI